MDSPPTVPEASFGGELANVGLEKGGAMFCT